jgi:hypothetical protein
VTSLLFFRAGMGIDLPAENTLQMLKIGGMYAAILVPAALLGLSLRRPGRYRTALAAALFILLAAPLWYWRAELPWLVISRPLPLFLLIVLAGVGVGFLRHRREESARRRFIRQISFLVFAMLLLVKMILNARIYHYGFILAMPATLLLSVAALDWIPRQIDRLGGAGRVFSAAAAAIFLVLILGNLQVHAYWTSTSTHRIGSGPDSFRADPRGLYVAKILERIASRASPGSTLAVFPEGAMINCLSGLRNPTPFIHLMPIEVLLYGEDAICEAYKKNPPDFIVLVHKDTSEFGFQFFGEHYARRLRDWIGANYRPVLLAGKMPFQPKNYGMFLLERKDRIEANSKPVP